MSSKLFKYDVVTLIELVESKPCLWDKTADVFKDRIEKQKAWNEVYAFFEEDFAQKDKKEQIKIAEIINGKWQNIRDAFVKSLKKKSGQSTSKKYLYHDNLTFLLKVVQSDDTESSIDDSQCDQHSLSNEIQDERETENDLERQTQRNVSETANDKRNLPKKARMQEDIDRQILKALKNPPDEDEAFFISILPFVRKMSEDDKLDFRMNVLQLIKNINGRKSNPPPLTTSTSRSTSSSSTPFSYQASAFSEYPNNSQRSNLYHDSQSQQQLSQRTYNYEGSQLQMNQQTYNYGVGQQHLAQPTYNDSNIGSPDPSTQYSP